MGCSFTEEIIEKTIAFHGHDCPGLTIGIRAAEYILLEFRGADSENLVCVTETDMCAVDGIQFLTGCTIGKGNLIHRDFGKAAFSIFDRKKGAAKRFVLRKDAKEMNGKSPENKTEMIQVLLEKGLGQLFDVQELATNPPRSARVLQSMVCQQCAEETMESRTRRFDGQTLCIPCFEKIDQKR